MPFRQARRCGAVPESQTDLGTTRSAVHSCSCACRASRLANQDAKLRRDGEEHFFQPEGTASRARAAIMASMGAVMVRPPFRPRSSSTRLRRISTSRMLSRSDSCSTGPSSCFGASRGSSQTLPLERRMSRNLTLINYLMKSTRTPRI